MQNLPSLASHVGSVFASLDGAHLFWIDPTETHKVLYDVAGDAIRETFTRGEATAAAFSDELLAIGTKTITLVDLETLEVRHRLKRHAATPNRLAFSSDGALLASAGGSDIDTNDRRVVIWDTATGAERLQIRPNPKSGALSLAFSGDASEIIVGFEDGAVRGYAVSTGEVTCEFAPSGPSTGEQEIYALVRSGERLFVAAARDLKIYDAGTGELLATGEGLPESVCFSMIELEEGRVALTRYMYEEDLEHVEIWRGVELESREAAPQFFGNVYAHRLARLSEHVVLGSPGLPLLTY